MSLVRVDVGVQEMTAVKSVSFLCTQTPLFWYLSHRLLLCYTDLTVVPSPNHNCNTHAFLTKFLSVFQWLRRFVHRSVTAGVLDAVLAIAVTPNAQEAAPDLSTPTASYVQTNTNQLLNIYLKRRRFSFSLFSLIYVWVCVFTGLQKRQQLGLMCAAVPAGSDLQQSDVQTGTQS